MAVAVGLDIGSDAVRAAVIESGKGAPVLKRFAEMPLPPGVVFFDDFESDQGWVTNPNSNDTASSGQWEVAAKRRILRSNSQPVSVRRKDAKATPDG